MDGEQLDDELADWNVLPDEIKHDILMDVAISDVDGSRTAMFL